MSAANDRKLDAAIGLLFVLTTALVIVIEWGGGPVFGWAAAATTTLALAVLAARVRWSRRVFLLIGVTLFLIAITTRPDWLELTKAAFRTGCFIAAFFTALATVRSAASTSPAIQKCGWFLAEQPPGRRYLALTLGGHIFGLQLNYGAIMLLGSLAEMSARREPDEEIRRHRIRRMLLAIQRGFISTLAWSPLGFAMAITTTIVPGATWADAVGLCLVNSAILAGLGYALDTIFKPRLSKPAPPRGKPEGSWALLKPLLALLGILVASVGALQLATGVRVVGVVMVVVPVIAFSWIAVQGWNAKDGVSVARRVGDRFVSFVTVELPKSGSELVLLVMAGFIGTMGAKLSAPVVTELGLDLSAAPAWTILLGMFWLILVSGQIGMNPILAVSLVAPLLPAPEVLGISPSVMVMAITSGWALTGATSPYTASTLMVAGFGGVSALRVGLGWNGLYGLTCGITLCLWILLASVIF